MPYLGALPELQGIIRTLAPWDIKHARSVDGRFVEFLRQLPCLNVSFVFQARLVLRLEQQRRIPGAPGDFCDILVRLCRILAKGREQRRPARCPVEEYPARRKELLRQKKQIRVLCEAFIVSLLGGYVGSLLCRETALTSLCWMADRDRTNELGDNWDRFQITLIDIVKRNVSFSFTTANSQSDEWYGDLVRIPDFITVQLQGLISIRPVTIRPGPPRYRSSARTWPITEAIATSTGFALPARA